MQRLRFLTAGESHGQALSCIVEGIPAGLDLSAEDINIDLQRRQRGYGRGERMRIEQDRVKLLSGVRYGKTLGSPITLLIENNDWPNWQEKMAVEAVAQPVAALQVPRPGHADFAGMVKYHHADLRNVLERSSARETTARVAVGAIARKLLAHFGLTVHGHVLAIGGVHADTSMLKFFANKNCRDPRVIQSFLQLMGRADQSPLRCIDESAVTKMQEAIDAAKSDGDSVGGSFEIIAMGVPVGLGSHVHWDRRLDALLAAALMSIPAIKAVEIGIGSECAERPGSRIHDEIFFDKLSGYYRLSNHAGGIEGGISNGEPIIVRAYMKPLPTLAKPLRSVNVATREKTLAFKERADVCAVPAASVVGEAMVALVLADALCQKLGGDSLQEMKTNFGNLQHVPLGR